MDVKWQIPSLPETPAPWDRDHQGGYTNVWGITHDKCTRDALLKCIPNGTQTILIPGCGSETHLQQHLIDEHKELHEVHCTDWSQEAINRARASFSNRKVQYRKENTASLSYVDGTFDVALIVNSILSSDDKLNHDMVRECYRVLRPGGKLIGFFPTILCALDMSYLDANFSKLRESGAIRLEHSTFFEEKQGLRQIYYTPLRLARIAKEAGFHREKFEVVFFDSELMQKETERYYQVPEGNDVFIWEILAVLRK
jgi:ubiquinone/menaquinone biosynthesis C-methylase UbiE